MKPKWEEYERQQKIGSEARARALSVATAQYERQLRDKGDFKQPHNDSQRSKYQINQPKPATTRRK